MFATLADPASALRWDDLGLDPVLFQWGWITLRWYGLAYIAGLFLGGLYLLKLLGRPGAPLAERHVEGLAFSIMGGVILGGRLGYVFFYRPEYYLSAPLEIIMINQGGMSFHGALIGGSIGISYFAWKHGLQSLRIHDYVACCAPIGLFFGRLANFVNGELWGRETDVPWAVVFPSGGEVARHPSQLYQAGLEGLLLGVVLWALFWRTDARLWPGLLLGIAFLAWGASRFLMEFVRHPDAGLENLSWGLTMGQTLTLPLALAGGYLISTAGCRKRRTQVKAEA